jgi:hypothetical protein
MPAMSKPRKKPVKATAKRQQGHQLPTRVDEHMWALLEKAAAQEERLVSPMVRILLREALQARGIWVAPSTEEDE